MLGAQKEIYRKKIDKKTKLSKNILHQKKNKKKNVYLIFLLTWQEISTDV